MLLAVIHLLGMALAFMLGISVVLWGAAFVLLWLWGWAEYASDQIAEAVRQAMRP